MKNIVVIGSGTMGNGIAHVFAQTGFQVKLMDISEKALEKALTTITKNLDRQVKKGKIDENQKKATLENIITSMDLKSILGTADLVVEAASENFETKRKIFLNLDTYTPEKTILATNTSSISITKIAAQTQRPEKVIGMHFFNPVPVMSLVEIIKGYKTDDTVAETIVELSKKLGKVPTLVNDYPGFVSNRILMPMLNEAFCALYEGVAGVEEIDTVMKLGMAHPMGPLQLADFVGLDICLDILKVLHTGLGNPKYAPCPLLVKMVDAGNLGIKSKIGFYDYSNGTKDLVVAPQFRK